MTKRAILAFVVVAQFGCRRAEIQIPDAPDDATHMAVLVLEDGERIASTPLFETDDGPPPMELETDPSSSALVYVAAFRAGEVRADVDPSALTNAPVRIAGTADAVVGQPGYAWRRTMDDDDYETLPDPQTFELTSDALPACPTLLPDGQPAFVELSCFAARCPAQPRQLGCSLSLQDQNCGLAFDLEIGPRGGLSGTCEGATDQPERAVVSVACEACVADVYAAPFEPVATVTSRQVVTTDALGAVRSPPMPGQLPGLAVLDDRVVVASYEQPVDLLACDASTPPARFLFLDLDTLEEIGSVVGPPCVADLLADASGTGFFAVHGAGEPRLSHYDAGGAIDDDVELFPQETVDNRPLRMVALEDRIAILLPELEPGRIQRGFRLVVAETSPLRVRTVSDENDADIRTTSIAALSSNAVLLSDTVANGVFIYPADGTSNLEDFIQVQASQNSGSVDVQYLAYHPSAARVLGGVRSNQTQTERWGGMHVLEPRPSQALVATPFTTTFERRTDAFAALPIPGSSNALVMLSDVDNVAYVGVLDVDGVRFLPGMVSAHADDEPLGPGTVMAWGANGVAYAVHPLSGFVSRIVVGE